MSRNRDRLGIEKETKPADAPIPQVTNDATEDNPFSFVVPTEFVDLPSQGLYYPENHPLHKQDTIEIKQMTAKEEDILTSRSLLRKGVAIERVIQSLIMDKRIDPNTLLVGDRNAILLSARVSGYGNEYTTKVECPSCGTAQEYTFDLNDAGILKGADDEDVKLQRNSDGTFNTTLPRTNLTVTIRLLNGYDEKNITGAAKRKNPNKPDKLITNQLKQIMVAVNGNDTDEAIDYVATNLPSKDSSYLRKAYKSIAPNVDLTQHFACSSCEYESAMEVPLNAEFFWPDA